MGFQVHLSGMVTILVELSLVSNFLEKALTPGLSRDPGQCCTAILPAAQGLVGVSKFWPCASRSSAPSLSHILPLFTLPLNAVLIQPTLSSLAPLSSIPSSLPLATLPSCPSS